MRRKSDRKAKSSPEKKTPEVATRRSHRRKRQKSESSSEPETPNTAPIIEPEKEKEPTVIEVAKQTSNSNSDEEKAEQPVWQVKTSESPGGEIQKLKICLQRPSSTPERTERSPRRTRKHKHGTSLSQTDEEVNDSCEERSTRSKERRKNKKSRKSSSTGSGVEDSSQESLSVVDKSPSQGDKSPSHGDKSPFHGDKSPSHGDKSPHGDKSSSYSDKSPFQGDKSPSHGDKSPSHGEKSPSHGDKSPSHGDRSPSHGDRSPSHGGRSPSQGDKSPSHGNKSPSQDDKSPSHNDKSPSRDDKPPSRDDKSPPRNKSPTLDEKSALPNEKSRSNDSSCKNKVPSDEDKLSSNTETSHCDKALGIVELTPKENISLDKDKEMHGDSMSEIDKNIDMKEDISKININKNDKSKCEEKLLPEEYKQCEAGSNKIAQKVIDSADNDVSSECHKSKDDGKDDLFEVKKLTCEDTDSNVNINITDKTDNESEKQVTNLETLSNQEQKESEKEQVSTVEKDQTVVSISQKKLSETIVNKDNMKELKIEDKNSKETAAEKSEQLKPTSNEVQFVRNEKNNKTSETIVSKNVSEGKNDETLSEDKSVGVSDEKNEENLSEEKSDKNVKERSDKEALREKSDGNAVEKKSDEDALKEKSDEDASNEKKNEEVSKDKSAEDTSDSEQSTHEDNIGPQKNKSSVNEIPLLSHKRVVETKNQNVMQERDQNIAEDKNLVELNTEDDISEITSSFTDENEPVRECVGFEKESHNARKSKPKEKNVDTVEIKQSSESSIEIKDNDSRDCKSNNGKVNAVNNKLTTVSTTVMHPQIIEIHVAPLDPARKRSRWKSVMNNLYKTNLRITSYDVREICPDVEMLSMDEVYLELETRMKSSKSLETEGPPRKIRRKSDEDKILNSPKETPMLSPTEKIQMMDVNPLLANRKISIVSDEANNFQQPLSPAKNDPSPILYVRNLVRPFTLNQLKELLSRTGNIVENGFWINKIKSECYVQYESEDQAIETRNALHGVHWPVANGRRLDVDFGTKEDMEKARNPPIEVKPVEVPKLEPTPEIKPKEEIIDWREERERERVRREQRGTREWDVGKHGGRSPSPRHRKHSPPPRSPSPEHKSKKKEDVPVKLLDDLFRKTKATPCIYWLPLSAEMIVIKEEQRRKHMAEHERRMAEIRRAERMRRNPGRGPRGPPRHD